MGYKSKVIVGVVTNKYLQSFWDDGGFHKSARIVDKKTGMVYVGTVRDHMDNIEVGATVEIHCRSVNSYKLESVEFFRRVTYCRKFN